MTRLDSRGHSATGWPLTLDGVAFCDTPMPVEDGSVRFLCTIRNLTGGLDSGRAYAFDASGRARPGWPVEIDDVVIASRLVGDSLRVLTAVANDGIDVEGADDSAHWFLQSIDTAGATTAGVVLPQNASCCVSIGPDGAAYAVGEDGDTAMSGITAFDLKGILPRYPTTVVGLASAPSFDRFGNPLVLSSIVAGLTSRLIMVFDTSVALPFAAAEPPTGDTGSCESTSPFAPVIGARGMAVVYSDFGDTIFALDPSTGLLVGWPFALADKLVHPSPGPESEHEAGYCPGPLAPVIGPDGTVYLALDAHTS
ncbi:MAG: hypothetical protein ABI553_10600, partial [Chloroflexota bacterium]